MVDPFITPLIVGLILSAATAAVTEIAILTVHYIRDWFRNQAAQRSHLNHDELNMTIKKAMANGTVGYALTRYSQSQQRPVASQLVRARTVDNEIINSHRGHQVVVW